MKAAILAVDLRDLASVHLDLVVKTSSLAYNK